MRPLHAACPFEPQTAGSRVNAEPCDTSATREPGARRAKPRVNGGVTFAHRPRRLTRAAPEVPGLGPRFGLDS